jgi:hypothetical protein
LADHSNVGSQQTDHDCQQHIQLKQVAWAERLSCFPQKELFLPAALQLAVSIGRGVLKTRHHGIFRFHRAAAQESDNNRSKRTVRPKSLRL